MHPLTPALSPESWGRGEVGRVGSATGGFSLSPASGERVGVRGFSAGFAGNHVVPINVVCTHCESRLNLQEELLGKQMRCPICLEVFTVATAAEPMLVAAVAVEEQPVRSDDKPAIGRADAPAPKYRSGSITDFIQVLPSEAHEPPAVEEPTTAEAPKEVVWSATAEPPPSTPEAPREIAWSEHVEPPGDPAETEPRTVEEAPSPETIVEREDRHEFIRPRKKRGRLVVLVVLVFIVLGGLSLSGYFIKNYLDAAPDRLFALAKKEYDARNYEPARKYFEEFVKEHGDDPRATEARFFVEMCALRLAIYSVSVRADPLPAQQRLDAFLKTVQDPALRPFVEPSKFSFDVWESALKLTEEVATRGHDLFNREKPEDSLPWLKRADDLGKIVDSFRAAEQPRENIYKQIDELRQKMTEARGRLDFLADTAASLAEPDDDKIFAARKNADERGFNADPAILKLINDAERKILDLVGYKPIEPPVPPTRDRRAATTGLLFAPRLDTPVAGVPLPAGPATVFFALVHGVLYAHDENDGHVLWAMRTGIDSDTLPLTIPGSELYPELALVISNDGAKAGLTACLARSGETFWHQALPSACIGQPALVGQRLYVPLRDKPVPAGQRPRRDEVGVVLEIELATGLQIGRISLGRPIGAAAVRRPGTGQLFFPAEARGVYGFDVGRLGPDGARLDPVKLDMVETGHAAGSLRGDPIITPGDGDSAGYLILGIADGLDSMKLRAFALPAGDKAPAGASVVPAPIELKGWLSFPPYADTEKLALVTDRGEFDLFGIRQAGNFDAPIFAMPPEPFTMPESPRPSRGQVVYADEERFWFLARGALHQLRLGFDFARGLKLVRHGVPLPLGEPLHAPQVNARLDTALVVTQASVDGTCWATAINLHTGRVRWQRQLGLITRMDPIRVSGTGDVGDAIVLMDRAGGLYEIPVKPLTGPVNTDWVIDERWLLDRPFANVGSGHLLASADGKTVHALVTAQLEKGLTLIYRRRALGQPIAARTVVLPAPLAGNPVVAGGMVIVPLANGRLYRWLPDQGKALEAGPTWRGERVSAQAVCHLAAIDDEEFVAGDGARTLIRWRWPIGQDEFTRRGTLTLTERLGAPPLVLSDKSAPRLLVADVKGSATLWDAAKLSATAQPLQSWRPSGKGPIPIGTLSDGPFTDAHGHIGFIIDGTACVRLAPDEAGGWRLQNVIRVEGKIAGRPAGWGDQLVITERNGRCLMYDERTAKPVGQPVVLPGNAAPAVAAIPLDAAKLLAPLADGTLLLLQTAAKKPERPPVFFYPLPPSGVLIPLPLFDR